MKHKPRKPARRPTDPKLAKARERIRMLREAVDLLRSPTISINTDTGKASARFVHAWSVQRGMSGITQALDSDGVIWERHTTASKVDGKWVVQEEWWEPISMVRRDAPASKEGEPS